MAAERRTYDQSFRAKAAGLAMTVGVKQAGRQLGVPYRTISHWLVRPDLAAVVIRSREEVANAMWQAIADGTAQVATGLLDPKARLGEKAQALRVLIEAHALMTGGATTRNENLNVNANPIDALSADETRALMKAIDAVQRHDADADALTVALDDPLSLTNAQIDQLIRTLEDRIGPVDD